jgi:hypothetical protein
MAVKNNLYIAKYDTIRVDPEPKDEILRFTQDDRKAKGSE